MWDLGFFDFGVLNLFFLFGFWSLGFGFSNVFFNSAILIVFGILKLKPSSGEVTKQGSRFNKAEAERIIDSLFKNDLPTILSHPLENQELCLPFSSLAMKGKGLCFSAPLESCLATDEVLCQVRGLPALKGLDPVSLCCQAN